MGVRTLLERVYELEGVVRFLSDRILVLEGDKERRERVRKQGLMVKVDGKWVRKDA